MEGGEKIKRKDVDKAPGLVNIQFPPELVSFLVKTGLPRFLKNYNIGNEI